MKVIRDCFGHSIRLTDERLAHILEHAEMAGMEDELERVLQTPTEVRLSRSDDQGFSRNGLQYRLKAGETVWPKR
jgi:hypothetical protein